MKKYFLFTAILIVFIGCAEKNDNFTNAAPSNRLPIISNSKIDKAEATIGDIITYTLEVDREKDINVDYSKISFDIKGLPVIDNGFSEPKEIGKRIFELKWFKFRVDEIGSYIIPSYEINYKINDKNKIFRTKEIFIEVRSLLKKGEDHEIKDIKPLVHLKDSYLNMFVTILILFILIVLFYFLIKRKRKKDTPKNIISYHDEAFLALSTLKSKNLINEGRFKEFYFELSIIFRLFLERKFNFPALENTQNEILAVMSDISLISKDHLSKISILLEESDMIKFAKLVPDSFQAEAVFEDVVTLILEMKDVG